MHPQSIYILNYFRKLYNIPVEVEIGHGTQNKKVNIAIGNWEYFKSLKPFSIDQVIWKKWKKKDLPFLFDYNSNQPIIEKKDEKCFLNYDIVASAFFFLSGWQEYVFMKKNNVVRFPYSECLQRKLNITKIPIVNYYFDILKEAIESVYNIQLKCRLFSRPVICLTHDIDKTNTGWKEDGYSELKKGHFLSTLNLTVKRFYKKDVWFNLEEILALEKKYDAKSSFYFLSKKGITNSKELANKSTSKKIFENADYDVTQKPFRKVLIKIQESGSEVGLHGSSGAHLDFEILQENIQKLGTPIVGGRFHNLLFDVSRTFKLLEDAGVKYDSTLGFAEEIGFRNGVVFPFQPYNFETNQPYDLVEIPLVIMDTTFRTYKKTPVNQVLRETEILVEEAQKFNGVLTILWHNNYFSPYKFAGWKDVYEELLKLAKEKNIDLLSGRDVLKKFMDE